MKKEVVVTRHDGSKVIYQVGEYAGTFYLKKYSSGLLSGSFHDIGKSRSFEDALAIIKSDAGNVSNVSIKDL